MPRKPQIKHDTSLGVDFVYRRTLTKATGLNSDALEGLGFRPYKTSGDRLHRFVWSEEAWNRVIAKLTLAKKPVQPYSLVLWDHRTTVYPLDHQYTDLTPEALNLIARVQYLKLPPEILETNGHERFLSIVADDFQPYWREAELRKDLEPVYGKEYDHEKHKYKAGRKDKPESWGVIDKALHDGRASLGIPVVRYPGYEADDLIASCVKQATRLPWVDKVFIITVDSDLLQLVVPEKVFWFNVNHREPRLRNEREALDYWEWREKVRLNSVRDIVAHKARHGDKADNLPPGSKPDLIDLLNPRVAVPNEVEVEIANLLSREPVLLDTSDLNTYLYQSLTKGCKFTGI